LRFGAMPWDIGSSVVFAQPVPPSLQTTDIKVSAPFSQVGRTFDQEIQSVLQDDLTWWRESVEEEWEFGEVVVDYSYIEWACAEAANAPDMILT